MRWFFDERLGRKRQVVRARPIRLASGLPGMRIELKHENGLSSDLRGPVICDVDHYKQCSSVSPKVPV
jgi:hypothetical protein